MTCQFRPLPQDLVCRLSFTSLDRLRSEVVEALCATSLPKWRLFARSLASVVRRRRAGPRHRR